MLKTIITTHKNPDFDGFAAAYAAKLIYEDAQIIIKGEPAKNLTEFINIYDIPYLTEKQFLEEYKQQIENKNFQKIVIVDTADIQRIPPTIKKLIESGIETDIYDHHPKMRENNIKGNNYSEEMGAATTLVVKQLLNQKSDLPDTLETLFLIAIHEDTGNFMYTTTTEQDHLVAAELLKRGARLKEVEEFVALEMTEEQRELFDMLYNNIQELYLNELNVQIAYSEIEKFIGGLNIITHKIFETLTPDILFTVVRMGKNIYIVARSKTNEIDLNKVLEHFGGGGHKKAGSAKVKDKNIQQVINKIEKELKNSFIPVIKASNIMSSPVRTILAQQKVEKAYNIMEQTGHSGLPVIDNNKLVGLVTKKDIEKAIKHKLSNAPIKAVMTKKIKVVDTETSVSQIRKIMAEEDIGRLPVLKKGVLVGIITRSDILHASSGVFDFSPNPILKEKFNVFNISQLMKERLPKRIMNLLRLFGAFGSELKMHTYVVGGFVRDLLLNLENYDIDIVVEGDANKYGKYVAEQLMIKYIPHKKFNTCSLYFKDGFRIDVATARTEYYEAPAELPKVEVSTIKKDLYRRDFSINTMAIRINQETFGMLLDFFTSKSDLENKIIRTLYPLSFVEDPTRILRAIRFEQRYGFKINKQTEDYLRRTVEGNYLEKVTGPRLREEIEKILKEPNPLKAIKRMGEFKIITHLFPYTYYTPTLEKDVEKLFEYYEIIKHKAPIYTYKVRKLHLLFYILLQYTPNNSLKEIQQRYGLPGEFFEKLDQAKKAYQTINEQKDISNSKYYEILCTFNNEQIIYTGIKVSDNKKQEYTDYLNKVKEIKLKTTGKDLKEKGYKGRQIKEKLEELKKLRLDEKITPDQEKNYI
ncbi:CBS domain-containing protein [Oceanotoga sp. DSM 15011]|jgi:tRNA nucleotidyltransferase (CCA-adding enzyme)|uniref:CBS domain-containing protein n=1 Tax=Oceanotoga sp. DSM 15011 TaxID=2984951 RepID=UPI0021F4639D|nr:CBS domain-containing protein [Oceanotoga sp. DSM 15011]UYO99143.1 CBS domain-containing protein [Oceanotoga sp. DSM 15011]